MKEVQEDLIIQSIREYSPFGLCPEVLIEQNGNPERTIGCVVGCLAMAAFHATLPPEEAAERSKGLYKEQGLDVTDEGLVLEYYGLTEVQLHVLMSVNDTRRNAKTRAREMGIPEKVLECIRELRDKFDAWFAQQPAGVRQRFGPEDQDWD